MCVSVVFVIRCLYSAVSLTLVREQRCFFVCVCVYFCFSYFFLFCLGFQAPTISFLPAYNVIDPDSDALTYALVAGGTYTDLFTINSVDGTLTNQLTLDRDEGAPNPIAVQVTELPFFLKCRPVVFVVVVATFMIC